MIGWSTDFIRLLWGLFYWNTRKSWFRYRRGRSPCPCQSPSDTGRAYETQCEPCLSWNQPARFRKVCPLLVQTKRGWRCSVDSADVRPLWRQALPYYGGVLGILYLTGVIGVFSFLRTVGYPISIVHVIVPPFWGRITQARSAFFLQKSNLAFDQDRIPEGLLYLANAYEFDPNNYAAGLSLAKHLQVGRPAHSDDIYQRLLREHPGKRHATAQDWFRALLARGSFDRIALLARDELLANSPFAPVWVRALIFAARRQTSDRLLRELVANPTPAAQVWRPILEIELLLRAGRTREARAALEAPWPASAPGFSLYYRVDGLIQMRDTFAALDLLSRYPGRLDPEATLTLRLDALAAGGMRRAHRQEIGQFLATPLTPANLSLVKILCAHLIRFPDPAIFQDLAQKLAQDPLPLDTGSAGIWFSLLCTAGAVGDHARLHEIAVRLRHASKHPFLAMIGVEAFFRGETAERKITAFLPILPLPLEVTYALFERYPLPAATPPPPGRA